MIHVDRSEEGVFPTSTVIDMVDDALNAISVVNAQVAVITVDEGGVVSTLNCKLDTTGDNPERLWLTDARDHHIVEDQVSINSEVQQTVRTWALDIFDGFVSEVDRLIDDLAPEDERDDSHDPNPYPSETLPMDDD